MQRGAPRELANDTRSCERAWSAQGEDTMLRKSLFALAVMAFGAAGSAKADDCYHGHRGHGGYYGGGGYYGPPRHSAYYGGYGGGYGGYYGPTRVRSYYGPSYGPSYGGGYYGRPAYGYGRPAYYGGSGFAISVGF
jgi:hypothetical protein